MDYAPCMNVLKSEANLNEPIENLRLSKMLVLVDFSLDVVAEVSNLAVLHYDDQLFKREITLLVRHNVRVVQILQQVDLQHGIFFLLLLETRKHNLFCDILFLLSLVQDQIGSACKNEVRNKILTIGAPSDALDFFVVMLVLLVHFIL